ncbi:hypothetical protein ANOM_006671 [Aspergillus nomiae NRRL 13137]|uniref:Uncharacterized protein n=1 Tax=Aspergillus nomiae NRRL (strain ATCC 15546 / NRRL 13137 / CBS 260.88 / M93) TaxID=1509407 RepID=A0A0L1IVA7_ASPN3|nr:uncharacterized protein ANOM_006671 [Aspergillus nomiae NRRL 13137]KNG83481.1 hypothetical protein ANOM_006671 [Aspergillus nomiae NRRL 13137]
MEAVLNRTEVKIKKILGKIRDNALHKEVDTIFNIARAESRRAIQSQKEPLPHIPVTSLNPQDVSNIFGIKEGGEDNPWRFTQDELRAVPDNLKYILADYEVATGGSPENEALMRCRIDAILLTCLAAQKRASARDSSSSILSVHLRCETDMLLPWTYQGERKIVSGTTDYSLWYQAPQEMECNLLVVEAKRKGVSGDYQALAYMAMLHHARKEIQRKDVSIYGIATDSFTWTFLYLDNSGKWSRRTYQWESGQGNLIVSMIHKIIRRAASLSKQELETSATSTGVKKTLSGNSKLEGFFHRETV